MNKKLNIKIECVKNIVKKRGIEVIDEFGNDSENNTENLCSILIQLDKMAVKYEKEKQLYLLGAEKLIDDLTFMHNKVFFRDKQVVQIHRISKKIIKYAIKIIKKLVKSKRNRALLYVNKMKELEKGIVEIKT